MKAEELLYGLQQMKGIGNTSIARLVEAVSAEMGIGDWRQEPLGVLSEIWDLTPRRVDEILPKKERVAFYEGRKGTSFSEIEEAMKKMRESGIRYLPVFDKKYPRKLLCITNPPYGIYVKGKLEFDQKPCAAVIGARICSEYGRYMARCYGKSFSEAGVNVISGMAAGVDGIAQKAALQAGGASCGVLGCGVDICYPPENSELYHMLLEKGCVLSEYPPGTKPNVGFFPMRNRIISALSDAVIVIEAREKSGTLITADMALEQGKEVYAVPGRVTDSLSSGCNKLISQGAGVALSPENVLEEVWGNRMMNGRVGQEKGTVSEDMFENNILKKDIINVLELTPQSLEEIYKKICADQGKNFSLGEVTTAIMELCVESRVVQNYVNFFSLKI